eukprot:2481817-Rhodomonas_salina.2
MPVQTYRAQPSPYDRAMPCPAGELYASVSDVRGQAATKFCEVRTLSAYAPATRCPGVMQYDLVCTLLLPTSLLDARYCARMCGTEAGDGAGQFGGGRNCDGKEPGTAYGLLRPPYGLPTASLRPPTASLCRVRYSHTRSYLPTPRLVFTDAIFLADYSTRMWYGTHVCCNEVLRRTLKDKIGIAEVAAPDVLRAPYAMSGTHVRYAATAGFEPAGPSTDSVVVCIVSGTKKGPEMGAYGDRLTPDTSCRRVRDSDKRMAWGQRWTSGTTYRL